MQTSICESIETASRTGVAAPAPALPLLNRAPDGHFAAPADGWYHLVPRGTFLHRESNTLQVLDDPALDSIARRFQEESLAPHWPGLLIDFDHFSYDPESASEAAGWLHSLERRADGLWGRVKWSDKGEAAVSNGRYRFVSPTWLARDCEALKENRGASAKSASPEDSPRSIRPLRLDSLALTNSPNLRGMAPLSNRTQQNTIPGSRVLGTAMSRDNSNKMKTVCSLLGLSIDASEEAIHAEVGKLLHRVKAAEETSAPLKNRVAQLETENIALLAAQVDTDLELHKRRYPAAQRDAWKTQLLANRAATLALLGGLPESRHSGEGREEGAGSTAPARIHNRETASDPGSRLAREAAAVADPNTSENRARAAAIRNRAVELRAANRKLTYDQAFKMAKNELASA